MREPEPKLRQRSAGRLDRSREPAIPNAALAAEMDISDEGRPCRKD
jgi:hypothetical protein